MCLIILLDVSFRNEATEVEDLEDKPKNVPSSVKLTVSVLERSLHFLPSKDEHRQILVLDVSQIKSK